MRPEAGSIVWCVGGTQGIYSDRVTWTAGAFLDRAQAESLAARLASEHVEFMSREDRWQWEATMYDPAGPSWVEYDRKYKVEPLMVHHAASQWLAEREVMLDKLRELGEVP